MEKKTTARKKVRHFPTFIPLAVSLLVIVLFRRATITFTAPPRPRAVRVRKTFGIEKFH